MFRSPPRALPLLLLPLLSTACGPRPVELVRPEIPAPLLACQPAPPPPPPGTDDHALALWIVDLATAGEDCRARLRQLKGLLDG